MRIIVLIYDLQTRRLFVDRSQKEEQVAALKRDISESELVVVTHYIGITMTEMTVLREIMREAGRGPPGNRSMFLLVGECIEY